MNTKKWEHFFFPNWGHVLLNQVVLSYNAIAYPIHFSPTMPVDNPTYYSWTVPESLLHVLLCADELTPCCSIVAPNTKVAESEAFEWNRIPENARSKSNRIIVYIALLN